MTQKPIKFSIVITIALVMIFGTMMANAAASPAAVVVAAAPATTAVAVASPVAVVEAASATTAAVTAAPTASTVLVDGRDITFDAYNIADFNYFKLRDLAYVLNGSPKQFSVGWDEANNSIALVSGQAYEVVGGEMVGKGEGSKRAIPTSSRIYLDGTETRLEAFNIEGNNYFKLRDIGRAFDFGVDWDDGADTIVIDTGKGYTEEDGGDADPADQTGQDTPVQTLPQPVGNKVYNNGSTAVQYGDCFYFYSIEYNALMETYEYGIYARRENEAGIYKLLDAIWTGEIYVAGDYIISSNYTEGFENVITCRINIITGEADINFINGEIVHVDYEAGEIYFKRGDFYALSGGNNFTGAGLYKHDLDGKNEQFICDIKYDFLIKDGDTIYLQDLTYNERDSYDAVLYTIKSDGTDLTQLAVIPALIDDEDEFGYYQNEYIQQIDITPDWIYMTVGNHQGTGMFFYGGLVRVKRDGSGLERLMSFEEDEYFIVDGWLYLNTSGDEPPLDQTYGGYRIRIDDLSGKEYLGSEINYIISCGDGRVFYNRAIGYDDRDLYSRVPDAGGNADDVRLFSAGSLPPFDHLNYMSYRDVQPDGDYVFFTVYVNGYTEEDSWRGHDEYQAYYRTRADGSGLTLINEDYLCPW